MKGVLENRPLMYEFSDFMRSRIELHAEHKHNKVIDEHHEQDGDL